MPKRTIAAMWGLKSLVVVSLLLGMLLVSPCLLFAQDETPAETPTETPTVVPTNTPVSESPAETPTATPVPPTNTPVPTNTPASETPAETPTATPEPTNTPVPTNTPTSETPAETPTATPEPTNTPVPTNTPTSETPAETPTATPVPTNTPVAETPTPESPTATPEPTNTPVAETPTPESPTATPEPTDTPVPGEDTPTPAPTNTPTPLPTATPTPGNFFNPAQGISVLDGFGGLHELGDVFRLSDHNGNGVVDGIEINKVLIPYFANQDIYRDIELFIENEGTPDAKLKAMIAATGNGRTYSAKFVEENGTVRVVTNYLGNFGVVFPSNDIVRDIEFFPDTENAFFTLFNDGSIYAIVDKSIPVLVARAPANSRNNPAVDMEVVSVEQVGGKIIFNGYVLLAKGQIMKIGNVPQLVGSPVSPVPIFVDMELIDNAAVVANGFGQFFIANQAGTSRPEIPLPDLGFGQNNVLAAFDIQVDPSVTDFDGIGIFAVTNIGTVHTAGAADFFLTEEGVGRRTDLVIGTTEDGVKFGSLNINFDIVRDIEAYLIQQQ